MAVRDLNAEFAPYNVTFKLGARQAESSFSYGVNAALDLSTTAFGGLGIHGASAAAANSVCKASAYSFGDANVAQVAYGCDATELSHNLDFPNFMRLYPAAGYEGHALADLISVSFGWKRLLVVYSSDTYGMDVLSELQNEAVGSAGIHLLTEISESAGKAPVSRHQIKRAKEYDPRIIALLVSSPTLAAEVLSAALDAGLLSKDTTIITTAAVAGPSAAAYWAGLDPTSKPALALNAVGAVLGVAKADDDWRVTAAGSSFLSRFLAQAPSVTQLPGGDLQCHNDTDDDGHFSLYKGVTTSGHTVCTGLNFSALRRDGMDLTSIVAHTYDATRAIGLAVLNYSASLSCAHPTAPSSAWPYVSASGKGLLCSNFSVPVRIAGDKLKAHMLQHFRMDGVTGFVSFSSGRENIDSYGAGDRLSGVRYSVLNLQRDGVHANGSFVFRRVGTWMNEDGYASCKGDPTLQSYRTGGCYDIAWGTPGNVVPSDRAPALRMEMPAAQRQLLAALGALLLCVVSFFLGVCVYYRRKKLLKAAQPAMLLLVLLSGLLGAGRVLLSSQAPSDGVCLADYWLGHLAFTGVVALCVKTLRVHLVVNSGLKHVKITTQQVLLFTLGVDALMALYMLAVTIAEPPRADMAVRTAITGQQTFVAQCSERESSKLTMVLDGILYAFEGCVLLIAAKLCHSTKDLPDAINESQVIAVGEQQLIAR